MWNLARTSFFVGSICVIVPLMLGGGKAYCAQIDEKHGGTSNGQGMYGTYVDKSGRFFSDSLGRAYPIAMEDLLPELMNALKRLANYPVPETLPKVHRAPHAKIEEIACGRPCPALGAYLPGEGIYLDEALQPETNVFARSVLLHELVHYVQDVSARWLKSGELCDRWFRREKEAYAIQERFLALTGNEHRVAYSTLFGNSAVLGCEGVAVEEAVEEQGKGSSLEY